jgi:hypothetical protein
MEPCLICKCGCDSWTVYSDRIMCDSPTCWETIYFTELATYISCDLEMIMKWMKNKDKIESEAPDAD